MLLTVTYTKRMNQPSNRGGLFICRFLLLVLISMSVYASAESKISANNLLYLNYLLQRHPTVRVIVGIDSPMLATIENSAVSADQAELVQAELMRVIAELNITDSQIHRTYQYIPYMVLNIAAPDLTAILQHPDVIKVDPDTAKRIELKLDATPSIVEASRYCSGGYCGAGQTIAVFDTGVDYTHTMLAGKVVDGACFSNSFCAGGVSELTGSAAAGDRCYAINTSASECYHGTHVAGIAAGRSISDGYCNGCSGIARDADIISIQVFSEVFDGTDSSYFLGMYSSDELSAFEYIYSLRNTYSIAAINMSYGSSYDNVDNASDCDYAYSNLARQYISLLNAAQIAIIAASGNDGQTSHMSAPACLSDVISVGSTTDSDNVSSFTNLSVELDFLAPGSGIKSAIPGADSYAAYSGTSMATPHVAGAYAIMRQVQPDATVADITAALKATAEPVATQSAAGTVGRINISSAADSISASVLNNSPQAVRVPAPLWSHSVFLLAILVIVRNLHRFK